MLRAIFAIIIIIGFAGTWLYFSFTSNDKLLIKCANKNYKDTYGIGMSNNLKKNFNFDKKYIKIYQDCEMQLNNSPKTFKRLYK